MLNFYFSCSIKKTHFGLVAKGHSKAGNIVDSIHMKIEISDNTGTIYEMNGVARTRFAEDDY